MLPRSHYEIPMNVIPPRVLVAGFSLLSLSACRGADASSSKPWPIVFTSAKFTDVAAFKGRWVATSVGGSGLRTSEDGKTWSHVPILPGASLYEVAASPEKVVAVGDKGARLVSDDGLTWRYAPQLSFGSPTLRAVVYGGGRWVAVGSEGSVTTSTDGETWERKGYSSQTGNWLSPSIVLDGVAYGNGRYVVVGNFRGSGYSDDGVTWVAGPRDDDIDQALRDVVWAAGKFVAVGAKGDAFVSEDGIDWTRHDTGAIELDDVEYDGERFVAVGGYSRVYSSTDGVTWTGTRIGEVTDVYRLLGIGMDGGRYVVVGDSDLILTSSDLTTWQTQSSWPVYTLRGVAFGAGRFVALGDRGFALTSTDGLTWEPLSVDVGDDFVAVQYVDGRFVAVTSSGIFLRSTDGVAWERFQVGAQYPVFGLAGGEGVLVTVGPSAEVRVSHDVGATWSEESKSGTSRDLSAVAWGGGQFVAVAGPLVDASNGVPPGYYDSPPIVYSEDGDAWQEAKGGLLTKFFAVTYGAGRFVAVGDTASAEASLPYGAATSVDGTAWEAFSVGESLDLYGVGYTDQRFTAVGIVGTIMTSPTGSEWTLMPTSNYNDLRAVTFGAGRTVAVGDRGTIVVSP